MTFEQFENMCSLIYKTVKTDKFSFDDCMKVFRLYFAAYRGFTGEGHPIPRYKQIATIMEKMPFADEEGSIPLEPEDYEVLIPAYFMIPFPNSDRNISHFFSGKIRENRFFEILH